MPTSFRLLLVTDRKLIAPALFLGVVEAALKGGVDAVQLREKDLPTRDLLSLAQQLRELTRRYGAKLLINDRIDVALAVQADGVHLPAASFTPSDARRLLQPQMLMGVSTHSLGDVQAAQAGGTDYVVLGPIYETPSKATFGPALGVEMMATIASQCAVPVLAIGGINAAHSREVIASGAAGVAVISAVLQSDDPQTAAAQLVIALDEVEVARSRR